MTQFSENEHHQLLLEKAKNEIYFKDLDAFFTAFYNRLFVSGQNYSNAAIMIGYVGILTILQSVKDNLEPNLKMFILICLSISFFFFLLGQIISYYGLLYLSHLATEVKGQDHPTLTQSINEFEKKLSNLNKLTLIFNLIINSIIYLTWMLAFAGLLFGFFNYMIN